MDDDLLVRSLARRLDGLSTRSLVCLSMRTVSQTDCASKDPTDASIASRLSLSHLQLLKSECFSRIMRILGQYSYGRGLIVIRSGSLICPVQSLSSMYDLDEYVARFFRRLCRRSSPYFVARLFARSAADCK